MYWLCDHSLFVHNPEQNIVTFLFDRYRPNVLIQEFETTNMRIEKAAIQEPLLHLRGAA